MVADERELVDAAVRAAIEHRKTASTRRVWPDAAALAALDEFASVSVDHPIGAERAVELLATAGSAATVNSVGGRYFGFVNGGTTPEAYASAVLATAWDQNVALPVMSPAASAIDAAAATMLLDVLGLPGSATATFCAGATIANITAVVAARDALLDRAGWSVDERGLGGSPSITVVTGEEAHVSALKALRIAGIGRDQVVMVPCDDRGRLDPEQMPSTSGLTLVLLQAGNVNTGHSDPFDEVIDRLDRDRSWVHVDGAFGLWANAAPERRASVAGIERADSWATDAHKWLNSPYDCGVVACADGRALRRAMSMDAAYVESPDGERALMNLGLQMSQAARAVPVWAILASRGRAGIAEAVEHTCRCAERFASRLSDQGVDVLVPVALNQALVAFGDDSSTDAVVQGVQEAGKCWMGATTWQGRRAMRISVSDLSTTFDDVDASVDSILEVWGSVPRPESC